MKMRSAKIGIHQENSLGRLGSQGDGQVDRREGFVGKVPEGDQLGAPKAGTAAAEEEEETD